MSRTSNSRFLAGAGPRTLRTTSAGPVELPILYADTTVINVVFRVPPAGLIASLGSLRLSPVVLGGHATVVLTVFDYGTTSIDPYRELSVGSLVRRTDQRGTGAMGFWVHALPVTTPVSCAAGRDIWGYPKWTTPIDYEQKGGRHHAGMPGDVVIESVERWPLAVPSRAWFHTFTELNGTLIRTKVRLRGRFRMLRASQTRLTLTPGGRVATLLAELGCDRTGPSLAFLCESFESILDAGVAVGPSRSSGAATPFSTSRVKAS